MANGYDHRFSSVLFERFGVDAELRQLDVGALVTLFECGKVDFFLASVRSALYECSHVVVVDGYRNGVFTVVDPADPVYRAAVRFTRKTPCPTCLTVSGPRSCGEPASHRTGTGPRTSAAQRHAPRPGLRA